MDLAKTIAQGTQIATVAANLMPTVIRLITGSAAAWNAFAALVKEHGDAKDMAALADARARLQLVYEVAAREAQATQ